jgi:SOS-response transcriptional repressor LexA
MTVAALEISNVLGYLIKQAQITEAGLAKRINIPRATINRLASGKTPDPRASTLNAIAAYFNVSVDQLLGKQPLFSNNNHSIIAAPHASIPVIEWQNAKNWQEFALSLKPDKHFNWVMVDPSSTQGKFALCLKGESMWPQFQENTLLLIDPDRKPENRDFILAYIKKRDEIVFRQLIVEEKYRFLKAVNTIFPVIQLEEHDIIVGIIIQTRKNYN